MYIRQKKKEKSRLDCVWITFGLRHAKRKIAISVISEFHELYLQKYHVSPIKETKPP